MLHRCTPEKDLKTATAMLLQKTTTVYYYRTLQILVYKNGQVLSILIVCSSALYARIAMYNAMLLCIRIRFGLLP